MEHPPYKRINKRDSRKNMKLAKFISGKLGFLAKKFGDYAYIRAGSQDPVDAVVLSPDHGISGKELVEANKRDFYDVVAGRIDVLAEIDTGSGISLLVEQGKTGELVNCLPDLMLKGMTFRFYLRVNDRKLSLPVRSIAQLNLFKRLFRPSQLREVLMYKTYHRAKGDRTFGREFSIRLRPVRRKNGWWVNIDTDVGNSPVEMVHLHKAYAPSTMDVTFPIDIVYTWVDGADPVWMRKKTEALDALHQEPVAQAHSSSRWENRDELKYSLRSVALFASWVRNIYIVTDGQVPDWLDTTGSDNIFVVSHTDLFPEGSKLPTFNSHAIESVLHRVEGLSEHFIYINDDVLFGAPVSPDDFFTPGGLTKAFFSRSRMPIGSPSARSIASEWGGMNASTLIEEEFGRVIKNKMQHTPRAIRRSSMYELEQKFHKGFFDVRNSQFRTSKDVAPASLYSHYSVVAGTGVASSISYSYLDIGSPAANRELARYRRDRRKVFCLNDTDDHPGSLSSEEKTAMVIRFLEGEFPWRSPWEKKPADR